MALPSTTVWEVRPTNGADTNGGGFVTGASGTDYSQQNSPHVVFDGVTIAGHTAGVTATVIITGYTVAATDVGNIVQITGGTGFTTGFYQIQSVNTGANTWTLDRNATSGAATGMTGNMGGALKTIGQVITILSTTNQNAIDQTVYVKAEAVISTAAEFNIGGITNNATFVGYTSTRTDNGQVTIKANASTVTNNALIRLDGIRIYNFAVDGNYSGSNRCSCIGFSVVGSGSLLVNCLAKNMTEQGFTFSNGNNTSINCVATNAGGGGNPAYTFSSNNGQNYFVNCIAYACPAIGFSGSGGVLTGCIAGNNTGTGQHGFLMGGADGPMLVDRCLAYGNGGDGFHISSPGEIVGQITNCISYGNGAFGINAGAALPSPGLYYLNYNAYGGNTSGNLNNVTAGANDVSLSADPTTAGASNNFALNSAAGGGAAVKGAGFPGVLQAGGTGHIDIGPLQSAAIGTTVVVTQQITRIYQEGG
jgi:hypothetical protein